ncbi:MAG: AMP-binding protein [Alphaproteobacteria bacterium]
MYMTQGLRRAAKMSPNETALISAKRSFTWIQFQDRVARLAGGLQGLGLKTEDRIAMLSFNSDRYAEYYYGVFWAGMNVVPMNIRWSVAEHIYSIKDSGARVLIVDDAFQAMAPEIKAACPDVEFLIHAGDEATPAGMMSYEDLVVDAAPVGDAFRNGEDLAGIFYTGGTTGFPKGVMLPHRALWTSAMGFGAGGFVTQSDRTVHAAPLFHIAGSAMLFSVTAFGGSHAIIPGFEPKAFLHAVEEMKGTLSLLVPTMVGMLLQAPELEAMEKMPETKFIHAYGQTELAPLVTLLGSEYHVPGTPEAEKIRSVGQPVPQVEAEVVDEDGQEMPRGQTGEIRVRGPNAMLGYWNKPEQTAETMRDGWIHTGDGGYMDEDGFIFIVDRVKDMIITGGENVFSAEVENAIMQFPGLAECAVIGIPHEKWGETVHAIVVPRAGQTPGAEAIMAYCRTLIAGFKCPRSVDIQTEALPKSGAGKIQKFELRAPFWEGRDRQVG